MHVVEALLLAERQIRLLERVRPLGLAVEVERLVSAWNSGNEPFPYLCYADSVDLSRLREGLAVIVERGANLGEWGPWLVARAEELALEAEMVEVVGTPAFGILAKKRFPLPAAEWTAPVEALVGEWLSFDVVGTAPCLYRTCDQRDPNSLYSVLRARLAALKLTASVRVEPEMSSVAATGDGSIRIVAGSLLSLRQARRIAEHEIVGHLLPRKNANQETGLLKCGCACSSADEEGRALVIEERTKLTDDARKRELALRHWACDRSRRGADFVEVVRELRRCGADVRSAVTLTLRCFRGSSTVTKGAARGTGQGGLGRELIYLPAYLRIKSAFEMLPALEAWFVRGRASLDFALFMSR